MSVDKEIQKLLKPNNIIILIGVLVIGLALCHYSNQKNTSLQPFNDYNLETDSNPSPQPSNNSRHGSKQNTQVVPWYPTTVQKPVQVSENQLAPVEAASTNLSLPSNCRSEHDLNPSELLPTKGGSGTNLPANFLNPSSQMGMVSSSLRNANLQLRSEPANPRINNLCPWNNSTITPDTGRVPFELGCNRPSECRDNN